MEYGFVTVKVNDLKESIRFYRDILGLKELARIKPREGTNIIFLSDENGSKIELVEIEGKEYPGIHDLPFAIGFLVKDLDARIDLFKKNNIIIRGPISLKNGIKILFIKDPNGIDIEIIENFNLVNLEF